MADSDQNGGQRRPRGMYTTRVDEKGRLKLNQDVLNWLIGTGNKDLFVTSFDGRTALLYPIPVWEQSERLLEAPGENSKAGRNLWFKAQKYGGDAEIDNQGRVLLPPTLRREMGVENAPVKMAFFRSHLEVYSEKEFELLDAASGEDTSRDLDTFTNLGLQ